MIKFFRKIRRKLLSENRFSKYFIYAIGEILLVVIGILIALQVNNLNEQSKTRDKELKYLVAIKNELNDNLRALEKEQDRLINSLDGQRKIIKLIDSESNTISEEELSKLINQAGSQEIILNYQNGVFVQLLNSGGINDISNDSIKNQIASWEGKMVNVKKQEKELESIRQSIINYVIEFGDFRTLIDESGGSSWAKVDISKKHNSNKPLLRSQTFENLIIHYLLLGYVLDETFYPELESNINLLLKLVKAELNE